LRDLRRSKDTPIVTAIQHVCDLALSNEEVSGGRGKDVAATAAYFVM